MNEITLKFDEYALTIDRDIINYLNGINGVIETNIKSNDTLYIKYDESIISLKILIKEVHLYLNAINLPIIISFNKHNNNNLKKYTIELKDLCCEYCLKGMIEDLLEIKEIDSVYTDFDFNNKIGVNIFIEYDDSKITEKELFKNINEITK